MRFLYFKQFRCSEGKVSKLLLVDGREHGVIDGSEGGLFLSKFWVKVVDVFWCFLQENNTEMVPAAAFRKKYHSHKILQSKRQSSIHTPSCHQ